MSVGLFLCSQGMKSAHSVAKVGWGTTLLGEVWWVCAVGGRCAGRGSTVAGIYLICIFALTY